MPKVNFFVSIERVILNLEAALQDPAKTTKQIGAMGALSARRAFDEQRLGNNLWPKKYPQMREPFINVAGALQDFSTDRKSPKPSRFSDRPALIDTGSLRNRIAFRQIDPYTVEWGTVQPYAAIHNWGSDRLGPSIQDVTDKAKRNLANWLFTAKTNPYNKSVTPTRKQFARAKYRKDREGYGEKLGKLFFKSTLLTNINKRPFLGITRQLQQDIIQLVQEELGRKATA